MDFKPLLTTLVVVLVALAAYDMFVKKALKISSYEDYESVDEAV